MAKATQHLFAFAKSICGMGVVCGVNGGSRKATLDATSGMRWGASDLSQTNTVEFWLRTFVTHCTSPEKPAPLLPMDGSEFRLRRKFVAGSSVCGRCASW